MPPRRFLARSARHAARQIRAELGTSARVLAVRPVPASGLARWFSRQQLEVLACGPHDPAADSVALTAQTGSGRKPVLETTAAAATTRDDFFVPLTKPTGASDSVGVDAGLVSVANKVQDGLVQRGLAPRRAGELVTEAVRRLGNETAHEEALKACLSAVLNERFVSPTVSQNRRQILIGPPGSGKSTVLAKWLGQAVLAEGRLAELWRLDHGMPNNAQWLRHCAEALGVRERRLTTPGPASGADLELVDLPGTDWLDAEALASLGRSLESLRPADVHLTLNLAYETSLLERQARAFAAVGRIDGLVFTHCDEEQRAGKVWNFTLGMNCCVRFLSARQNVPSGLWQPTSAELAEFLIN